MEKLDIERMQINKQILKVGELKQDVIDLLNLQEKPRNIKFAFDRIPHCEKHKIDFKDEISYYKSMEAIPQIINNPEYVGYNEKNNGIEYIKKLDDLTLVAVRLKSSGDLFLRSVYPISEVKLNNGLSSDQIKKM